MTLRIVDKINGHHIQKVITPKGKTLGYQVVREGDHDSSHVQRFARLSSAREAAQKPVQTCNFSDKSGDCLSDFPHQVTV
jgi:hypothetical protein